MRFESFMWTVVALILSGSVGWNVSLVVEPTTAGEHFEAKDGNGKYPPD